MAETKKPDVFVRESTGLVKSVSILDAVALNISNMSAGAALATIGFTMVALQSTVGVNLFYGSIIAFILSIPQIVVYTMMTRRMPRTGGDYVWVSRTFGGFLGSALSFMGYTIETLAYLALIVLSMVFAIGSVGLFFGYQNFLGLAVPGLDPTSQFILGSVIFALLIGLNIFRPKEGYKLVSGLIIFGIAALLIAMFVLIAAGQQGVVSYMNSLANLAGNSNFTYQAISSSYSGPTFDWSATLFILPFFAIYVYPWINAGPAVAAEIKGKSSVNWNVPIAALIVFLLVTSSFGAMYYVGGYGFITQALSNPSLVYDWSFNFWTLAMGVSNNAILAWVIGIGWIIWNIAILAYGIIVLSRYVFAQAFDRFLPSQLAYVSPKYGSPIVAYLFDFLITVGLVGAAAFLYGSMESLYAAVIASMIYFFFVGLAAATYGAKKEQGTSRSILVVAGILMSAVFLFIVYQFLSNPTIWGTSATFFNIPGYLFAYGYVVASFVAGAAIYLASRSHYKKKGIDISVAYKEIPPE